MRILVFGRNGQVARCLAEEAGADQALTTLGRAQADLASSGAAKRAIEQHEPDIIINAAAYTAVDKAEQEQALAHALNAAAPAEMAAAARAAGATFIHLSTDYVFSGDAARPYQEDDSPSPLNAYGRTKREGEAAIRDAMPDAVILRTSWVFSEFGDNFVKTMLRLSEQHDTLNIVADQIGGPTPARAIAAAALAIAAQKMKGASGAGLYHYQGAPAVSWAAFAEAIFKEAGAGTAVHKISTAEFGAPARRPANTVLDCSRIKKDFGLSQPDWRAALRQNVKALRAGRK